MKKKMMAGVMAAVLTAGMVMPVSAADPDTAEMSVVYEEPSTFTLSIPANVTLSETEGVSQTVGLSEINVSTTEKVQIKVSSGISAGSVTLKDQADADNTHTATVSLTSGGAGVADDAVVAEFEGTSVEATMGGTLYFSALGNVPAGSYSGQLVFQASIVNK